MGGGELVLGTVVDLLTGRGLQGASPRASPQLWLLCCPSPRWRRLHHRPHVLRPLRAAFLDPQACAGRKRQRSCVVTPCPAGRPPLPTGAPCQEHMTSARRPLPVTPLLAHWLLSPDEAVPGCREEHVREGAPAFRSLFQSHVSTCGSRLSARRLRVPSWPVRSRVRLAGGDLSTRGTRGLQAGRLPARLRVLVFLGLLQDLVSRKPPSLTHQLFLRRSIFTRPLGRTGEELGPGDLSQGTRSSRWPCPQSLQEEKPVPQAKNSTTYLLGKAVPGSPGPMRRWTRLRAPLGPGGRARSEPAHLTLCRAHQRSGPGRSLRLLCRLAVWL